MFHMPRVFAGVIKIRTEMRSYWIEADPKSNEGVLIGDREGHREAQRRRDDMKIEMGDVSTSQELPAATSSLRERPGMISPSEPPTLPTPSGLLDEEKIHFCGFKPPSSQQQKQMNKRGFLYFTWQRCP